MRWLAIAVTLLALLVVSAAWIALRDWRPVGDDAHRLNAMHNAELLKRMVEGDRPCPACRVDVLETDDDRVWRVVLHGERRRLCFDIYNERFGRGGDESAVAGAHAVACPGD